MAFWDRDAEAWVRRGERLERQGNRSGAEEAYRRADAAGSAEGAANLGMLLYELGAVDESRAALTRAEERGSATGTFRLGFLQDEQGAAAEAEATYRRAVERGDRHAANNLAVLLSRRGDWTGAREMYQRLAQSSDPQSAAKGRRQVARIDAAGGRRPRPVPPPDFDPDASPMDSLLWIAGDPADPRVRRAREIAFAHSLEVVARDPADARPVVTLWRELGETERADTLHRLADERGRAPAPSPSTGAGRDDGAGGADLPPPRRITPLRPSIEDAERRATELYQQAADMHALLAPTGTQGAEATPQRLVFARWSLDLGTALCEAGDATEGIAFLEAAAQIAEVVLGHQPDDAGTRRIGITAVATLAPELAVQGRHAEAWEWAARTVGPAREWAMSDDADPEGPLQVSRLDAVLASLSMARQPPPVAFMGDESVPGQPLTPVEPFYGLLSEAVDFAVVAVRRDPGHLPARLQLGQEAWNLGVYLQDRPGLPGGDVAHYARLVVEALRPLAARGTHAALCGPALAWAGTQGVR